MNQISYKLPFDYDSLEPYISAEIMHYHFDKHHQGYVQKYNQAIASEQDLSHMSLEHVMRVLSKEIRGGNLTRLGLFQNGAQAWNHDFLWKSMHLGTSIDKMQDFIGASFETEAKLREAFIKAGMGCFGSGWVWLVRVDSALDLCTTPNAEAPNFNLDPARKTIRLQKPVDEAIPLAVCDVWEHAYYLQYKNNRLDYLNNFFDHLLNWPFVYKNFEG